jgi:hypothetical protein
MDYFEDDCNGRLRLVRPPITASVLFVPSCHARFHCMSARWDKQAKMTMWPYRKDRQYVGLRRCEVFNSWTTL